MAAQGHPGKLFHFFVKGDQEYTLNVTARIRVKSGQLCELTLIMVARMPGKPNDLFNLETCASSVPGGCQGD